MGQRGPMPQTRVLPPRKPSPPLEPPSWLPAAATRVWRETEPHLRQAGRLRPEHADSLAQWCATAAELRHLAVAIDRDGPLTENGSPSPAVKLAARLRSVMLLTGRSLGLDPASAARLDRPPVNAENDPEQDEFEAFLNQRSDIAGRR
jgi:P27 family predicted phage terminase small subunit